MLESFFVQKQVLSRLRSGPMGPYLPELAAKLIQQHFARRTGSILLRTADRLGRWLAQKGVPLADATAAHLKSFAANYGRRHTGRLPQMVWGISCVTELLQSHGFLACPSSFGAGDQWLHRFDQHLLHVQGLTVKTRGNYLRYAPAFDHRSFRRGGLAGPFCRRLMPFRTT